MTLRDLYNKHCLRIEFFIGIAVALGIWCVWRFGLDSPELLGSDIQLFAHLAQIEATLLGFILTTLGVVFTQLNRPYFEKAREHPSFDELWRVFINTMKYLGFGVLVAWFARIFGPNEILSILNICAASVSFLRVGRCIWVLEKVIVVTLQPLPPIKVKDSNL